MVEKGVLEYFNLNLKAWNNRSEMLPLIEKKEEEWVFHNIKFSKKMKMLDFACGIGRWTNRLHNKVKEIIAIDISKKPLSILKNKKYHNVTTILGSEDILSNYKKYFDVIICAQAIEFWKNPKRLIELFYDSLGDGGTLIITTWFKERIEAKSIKGDYVIVKRPSDKKNIKVFFSPKSKEELKKLLSKFKRADIKTLDGKYGEFGEAYIKRKNIINIQEEVKLLRVAKAIK